MVKKGFVNIVIILFVTTLIIGIIILIDRDKEAISASHKLKFEGVITEKKQLEYEKGFFILINENWYGIIDYRIEQCIEIGDSIIKNDFSDCIFVKKRKPLSKIETNEFCETHTYLVEDKNIERRLNAPR